MGCAYSDINSTNTLSASSSANSKEKKYKEYKIVLLGNSGVGKSSLVLRFSHNEFPSYHEVTVGAAFIQQNIIIDGETVKIHVWDTGGQERFRSMAPLYYRDAHGAIVVFDVTNKESFDAVRYWVTQLKTKAPPGVIITVVSNKCDVVASKQVIEKEKVKEFCEEQMVDWIETSAYKGFNVTELFEGVAKRIHILKVK